MPRILTYSLIIVAVLACAGVVLLLTSVHRTESVSHGEIRARMDAASRLLFEREAAGMRAELAGAAVDRYLIAGIEEADCLQ